MKRGGRGREWTFDTAVVAAGYVTKRRRSGGWSGGRY
ncbi:terminase small subunit [Xylella fastidiosa subsp. multiplex]|uniref:Terminase small subunit n=1 Tax=Xylella fastidiosa subsp. multiplex TaxID=644357 RepID=A0AAW6HWR5_XYLFS|nr:terminase small subunit [Xylella fastidiosa subsp. multiplex]